MKQTANIGVLGLGQGQEEEGLADTLRPLSPSCHTLEDDSVTAGGQVARARPPLLSHGSCPTYVALPMTALQINEAKALALHQGTGLVSR